MTSTIEEKSKKSLRNKSIKLGRKNDQEYKKRMKRGPLN